MKIKKKYSKGFKDFSAFFKKERFFSLYSLLVLNKFWIQSTFEMEIILPAFFVKEENPDGSVTIFGVYSDAKS